MIYHKFSHGAAFYTLNGKNVNVMLEYILNCGAVCSLISYEIYLNAVQLVQENMSSD